MELMSNRLVATAALAIASMMGSQVEAGGGRMTCGQLTGSTVAKPSFHADEFELHITLRSGSSERSLLAGGIVPEKLFFGCLRDTVLLVVFPTLSGHEFAYVAFPDGTLVTFSDHQADMNKVEGLVRPTLPTSVQNTVPAEYHSWFEFEEFP
jgi:hypothetical protein